MKKTIKLILATILIFGSTVMKAQSTTTSYTSTAKFISSDFVQLYNAFHFSVPSFTGSTTKTYTSTIPFNNTDNLQIYNIARAIAENTTAVFTPSLYVPYSGATNNLNLGTFSLTANKAFLGSGTVTANTSTLGVVRIKQGSAFMDFGEFQTGYPCIWLQKATPSATNWQITDDANKLYLNGVNGIDLRVNQTDILGLTSGGVSYTGSLTTGSLGYTDSGILGALTSSVNGYNQFIIQNSSNAANASANVIVNNNLGTSSTNYGEFGMNSSTFTGTPIFNQPNATYLTATSGNLNLGTTTAHSINIAANNSSLAAISISTLNAVTIPTLTSSNTTLSTLQQNGTVTFSDAINMVFNTTTGTKIGTATNQKIGFFNSTPVVQQTNTTDLGTVLSNLGLRASGTAYPLTSSGNVNFTGAANTLNNITTNTTTLLGNTRVFSSNTSTLTMGATTGTNAVLSDVPFSITFNSPSANPVDASTYYYSSLNYPNQGSSTGGTVTLQSNFTLVGWDYNTSVTGVIGSAENSTLTVMANNTASTVLSSVINHTNVSGYNGFNATGLSASYTANDKINVRIVNPTWTTNPTLIFSSITLYFVRRP